MAIDHNNSQNLANLLRRRGAFLDIEILKSSKKDNSPDAIAIISDSLPNIQVWFDSELLIWEPSKPAWIIAREARLTNWPITRIAAEDSPDVLPQL